MTSRSNTKQPPAPSVDLAARVGKAGERHVPPILLPDGTLAPGAECPLGDEAVIEALVLMIRSRLVDERGVSFQRQGRIGTFSEARGQEGQKSYYHRGGDGLASRADATTARAGLAPF